MFPVSYNLQKLYSPGGAFLLVRGLRSSHGPEGRIRLGFRGLGGGSTPSEKNSGGGGGATRGAGALRTPAGYIIYFKKTCELPNFSENCQKWG